MTRSSRYIFVALALSAALPMYASHALAQESSDASASEADTSADASADTQTSDANSQQQPDSTSQEQQSSAADAQQSDAANQQQSDANGQQQQSETANQQEQPATTDQQQLQADSANQQQPQSSASSNTATGQSSAGENTSQNRSSLPQPSRDVDADARAHLNADADVDARFDANRSRTDRNARGDYDRSKDRGREFDNRRNDQYRDRNDDRFGERRDERNRSRDDRRFSDRDRRGRDFDSSRGIRFDTRGSRGLTVFEIERNGIYYDSGLRRGDVIISLHGQPVRSQDDFYYHVSQYQGERVPVIVLRDGRRETIYINYQDGIANRDGRDNLRRARGAAYLGVVFDTQARDAAVIASTSPRSPADEAGIRPGDEILALNGEEIRSYQDVISTVRSMRPGDEVNIIVGRGQSEAELQAVLAAKPSGPIRTARSYESDLRYEDRVVEPRPESGQIQVEADRYEDRGLIDRDSDNDGQRYRSLLNRLRN